jgi:hypothetical protein
MRLDALRRDLRHDALDLRLRPVAGRRRQHACRQQRCRRPVNIRTMPLSPENC